VGQGSCFSFELELPRAQLPAAAAPAALQIAGYEGPRKKVLVVDDVADNRSLAVHFLEPLGFEMFEAADGLQALEFAQALRPDLILMDVVMPRMDGLQATRALRSLPAFQSLPIIAASAISSRADEAKSLAAGADAFLPKPLDFERLLERIAALLKLRWTLTPPPSVPASSTR
ncbi:MAG: response regulator, partial [Betaproteobacteria bacterium]